MKPIFKQLFNLFILSAVSVSAWAEVSLVEGHVRAMPASVPNTAAYVTLKNDGAAKRLVAASTSVAKEAQLHTMLMEDGVMKMRQVANFEVPKNGQLVLSPSGDHIMILGLHEPLQLEQQITLSLEFDDGEKLTVTLPVMKKVDGGMSGHHHHH